MVIQCAPLGPSATFALALQSSPLACEQALRSRMGRKESGKRKVGQALLASLCSPISLGACSQASSSRAPKARNGGASIAIEICKPIKPGKFGYDVMSVRTSRKHGLGLGTSLPLLLL